ncbi:DUF1156 domain-containing protein [Candidatus Fermentibacteria bacterium]|nr:DUF1156 domain-containing protein [Candidatus Fermentibacteria bacterium]
MSVERNLDIGFVARLALREKQVQQNYRPIIAVHKWFARRPGTLFRSLLLAEFADRHLTDAYFRSNDLRGITVADPFMGGGTPLIEANRLGCSVVGCDINPMAYWIVHRELDNLDVAGYRQAARRVEESLSGDLGRLYRTRCLRCGRDDAVTKYFLWVKVATCGSCRRDFDLMPGYLVAQDVRHPLNVFLCPECGGLSEHRDRQRPGACPHCGEALQRPGPAARNRCPCPHCGAIRSYPDSAHGPPRHRMFAMEYHCAACRPEHQGRFFKSPDDDDLARYAEAERVLETTDRTFEPDDEIPAGDETDRLHRWGYRRYREMFNPRQLLGLNSLARLIVNEPDDLVRRALATNLSDLLRYQNMLCRYDTMALKSLDIFSVHGFPVGLVQCESNILGIRGRNGTLVGSGGLANITEKYATAKAYCREPFEIVEDGRQKTVIPVRGEWIGEGDGREISLHCANAADLELPAQSLDAVITDPPYFANVQYAELMDFCYVWLRKLMGSEESVFAVSSTRNVAELTGNEAMGRDLCHFTDGLSAVFRTMCGALKPRAPFMFTYHHNSLEAYFPVAVALMDAGLVCSASLPCPAEMGGSIHISGTGSSIIDTVFVCRTHGTVSRRLIVEEPKKVAGLVAEDIEALRDGGVKPTQGDIKCVTYGHLIRLAVWRLRGAWKRDLPAQARLDRVGVDIAAHTPVEAVLECLGGALDKAPTLQRMAAREAPTGYGDTDELSF